MQKNNIRMSFGLDKCGGGKVVRTEGIRLTIGSITDVEDNCKCLGIPQANGNHEEAATK